jgi:uncharacterized protein (DUF1330 family)
VPAYISFLIDIRDEAAFTRYALAAAPTYRSYGGHISLRGPIVSLMEGDLALDQDTRLVVIEFPSVEEARAWWDSDEYQAAVKLRLPPVSDSRVFLVDGVDLSAQPAPLRPSASGASPSGQADVSARGGPGTA